MAWSTRYRIAFAFVTLSESQGSRRAPGRVLCRLLITYQYVFDLIGTSLAQVGLLFTTVGYYQLLWCTVLVVNALSKVYT